MDYRKGSFANWASEPTLCYNAGCILPGVDVMLIKDLNRIVGDWPVEPGLLQVRKIVAPDGLAFLQLRLDLGVLQMAMDGRPDGQPFGNFETALEMMQARQQEQGDGFEIDPPEHAELVREMMQYYRRRISLMAMAKQAQANSDFDEADACYRRAVRDADHNLSVLDLLRHSTVVETDTGEEDEPYRPFILMHRTICRAERALLVQDPDEAIEEIKSGIAAIEDCEQQAAAVIPDAPEAPTRNPFIHELRRFERQIRKRYRRRRTLSEKLADAVAAEDFEQAAKLRDKLAARKNQPKLAD